MSIYSDERDCSSENEYYSSEEHAVNRDYNSEDDIYNSEDSAIENRCFSQGLSQSATNENAVVIIVLDSDDEKSFDVFYCIRALLYN